MLVHTAAGGVGSAAMQLALIAGLRVIGVAGTVGEAAVQCWRSGPRTRFNHRSDDVWRGCARPTWARGPV